MSHVSNFGIDMTNVTVVNSATYQMTMFDRWLQVNYTATGAVTLTLPPVAYFGTGMKLIKDSGLNSAAKNITIVPSGAETIDGAPSVIIATNGGMIGVFTDGTNFFIANFT